MRTAVGIGQGLQVGRVVFGPASQPAVRGPFLPVPRPVPAAATVPPKKGMWVVVDAEGKAIAVMLTKGLDSAQQAVSKSIRLRGNGRFSSIMASAWQAHGVAVVFATDQSAKYWEALQEAAQVPFPRDAVWMAME